MNDIQLAAQAMMDFQTTIIVAYAILISGAIMEYARDKA
ncbi:hypothetical protein JCM19240_2432 [Vibrio maritimus]|uniref:Uncharacterized protein n=1 Tax=Vibrio maritimus TaxID=990268 RepID=A0A090T1A1_9VIBR|nr:hypothetical protein JCM19240_2432 [Vibrio maritimus]